MDTEHIFNLDIGDWSNDGHGKCITFKIKSNKPLSDVHKAYFKAKKELPSILCPENIACDYEDSTLTSDAVEELKKFNFDISNLECSYDESSNTFYLDSESMLKLTLWFCNQGDSELKLEVIFDKIPSFHTSSKKHISSIGYGLYY